MADDPDYEIGYGKPPKATQFQKGQSGNPKGRPKGIQNTATLTRKLMAEQIMIAENGRERRMTMHEVLLRQMLRKGAKGDFRSAMMMLQLVDQADGMTEDEAETPDSPGQDEAIVHRTLVQMHEALFRDGAIEDLGA